MSRFLPLKLNGELVINHHGSRRRKWRRPIFFFFIIIIWHFYLLLSMWSTKAAKVHPEYPGYLNVNIAWSLKWNIHRWIINKVAANNINLAGHMINKQLRWPYFILNIMWKHKFLCTIFCFSIFNNFKWPACDKLSHVTASNQNQPVECLVNNFFYNLCFCVAVCACVRSLVCLLVKAFDVLCPLPAWRLPHPVV